jgi:raffinose/stachyose/melibiose transport system substrate-binding protein
MTPALPRTRPSRPRRRTVLALAAVSGALLVGACSPSSSGSSASGGDGGKVTLTVWSWRVEDEAAYKKIFAAYEKAHPGVTVDFQAVKATEYNKILATGLAGDGGPDVPQVRSYGQLQTTVASKSLLPLDGKVDLSGWDENVVASAKGKEDGKTYSVPLARQTVQMFYNQGLFDKNGVKAPTTWDEFIAANDKLAAAGVTPIAVGAKDDWTLPIVHEVLAAPRFGGKAFQQEVLSGQKSFTSPALPRPMPRRSSRLRRPR